MNEAVDSGFPEEARTGARRHDPEQLDDWLTLALEDSFPCSDPVSSMRVD